MDEGGAAPRARGRREIYSRAGCGHRELSSLSENAYTIDLLKGRRDLQELEILGFRTPAQFRKWLAANHRQSGGIWLRICKKHAEELSVTYAGALDEALCFGWIDGQKQRYDDSSWLQKFTPRRPKSGWSKINTQHAERLIQTGRMKPPGHSEINAAKNDGRWTAAYDSPSKSTIPEDFLAALRENKRAAAFFETLNKANLYAIAYRLQTAKKPETRQKRMEVILAMLAKSQPLH